MTKNPLYSTFTTGEMIMKKNPDVDEETNRRIDGYAEAIKNFGLKKLLNNLRNAQILESEYNYNTFKTQYRRLKKNKTGPLLKLQLLLPILRYLDGFTYKDLFGEDETVKNDAKEKKTDETLLPAISKIIEKHLLSFYENNRRVNQHSYSRSIDFINSAQIITTKIIEGFRYRTLHYLALSILFIQTTYPDKKAWKHGYSDQLSRIEKIVDKMTSFDHQIFNLEVMEGRTYLDLKNRNTEIEVLFIPGNLFLVIAYEIFLIEQLFNLFSKRDFNYRTETLLKIDNNPKNDFKKILKQKISIQYNDDINREDFINRIKEFYTVFDTHLKKYFDIEIVGFNRCKEENIPSKKYIEELYNIICFLCGILTHFTQPNRVRLPELPTDSLTISTMEMLKHQKVNEENYSVTLTQDILINFDSLTSFFKNLVDYKINTEQNRIENINFNKMKIKGPDGKIITPHFISRQEK